jgi:hypothetical protein
MRVDIAELGRRAFALLLNSIIHPRAHAARHERVATTLVVRSSCMASSTTKNKKPHRAARSRKSGPGKGDVS